MTAGSGPLRGVRVLEFGALGPVPFAGMMLADMGAQLLRIARADAPDPLPHQVDHRGRPALRLDLKDPASVAQCLALCEDAEIVIEGSRPGVMERLGLGPVAMLARNPALVYGRMTGWGQTGPMAAVAGHDINYLAISGALHAIGTADQPLPPLNLAADYGGGAMILIAGILAALVNARATGQGQVVDAAMAEGAAYLMSVFHGLHAAGDWQDRRQANLIDGAAPFYGTYRCADGQWIAVGAIEPHFYHRLVTTIGAPTELVERQMDAAHWPVARRVLDGIFGTRSRDDWCAALEHLDVCVAPVLALADAPLHPQNSARAAFATVDGIVQPAPAPRFSATPSVASGAFAAMPSDPVAILAAWRKPAASRGRA